MTLLFDIEQNITQDQIFFKDNTEYDSDVEIIQYDIIYTNYLAEASDTKYVYEITDATSIAEIKNGLYILTIDFNDGIGQSMIVDDAYSFDISVTYNTTTTIAEVLSYSFTALFYQGVYNVYSQIHLDYNWTKRYKGDDTSLLCIAEELTWIDSLRLASANQNRPDEFISILDNLQRYFTLNYDY